VQHAPSYQQKESTMPTLDVVIKGQMVLPEVSTGPLPPGAGGGSPPGISGGPGSLPPWVMPPIVIPPEFIADVHPEHPIVIPPPLGFWGGQPPAYVDIGGPGAQPGPSHPIAPTPGHPIVIPPDVDVWPPNAKPEHPIVLPPPTTIWPPLPTHPIVVPPDGPPTVLDKWDVIAYWTPSGGWAMAIVPSESHPGTPTPSA
jgi:hypothetical protein